MAKDTFKKDKVTPIPYDQVRSISKIFADHRYGESRCNDPEIEDRIPSLIEELEWGVRFGFANEDEFEEFRQKWQSTSR
jgi:hypothetical protein